MDSRVYRKIYQKYASETPFWNVLMEKAVASTIELLTFCKQLHTYMFELVNEMQKKVVNETNIYFALFI